jgi:hypothetical protein
MRINTVHYSSSYVPAPRYDKLSMQFKVSLRVKNSKLIQTVSNHFSGSMDMLNSAIHGCIEQFHLADGIRQEH